MKKLFLFFIWLISILPAICQTTIVMEKKGDVYYVPGEINGVPLKFIFDTGASNVYLSLTEALFMLKNGYLSEKDFGKTSYSQIANGDIVENTEVLLKEVKVGPIVLNNVTAMVSNTISAPLLLGQSAIQKLGPIQLDGNKLIISSGKELPSNEKAYKLYQQAYQYSEAGKYEDAIKLSYEALKLSNDTNLRAYLYDNIAYAYKNLGDTKKAIDIMNQALGEDLMAEQPGFNLGVYLFDDGKYFEALNAFNNYIMRHPNTTMVHYLADAYAYKGDCHIKLGQIKEGENAYKLSISTQAGSQAYLGLADLYLESNKLLDAAYYYTLALEFEPNRLSNIKRWHQLGYCYAKLGKNDKAFDAFENCKKAFEANNNLIVAAIKSGKKELSLEAIAFSHYGLNAQLWLARLSPNANEIIRNIEIAYELPDLAEDFIIQDYLLWESAYLEVGNPITKYNKCKEILKLGLSKYNDNPDLLFELSLLIDYEDISRLEYLNKILDQEFSYKPLYFTYGSVYNEIGWTLYLHGKLNDALECAETAVIKDPEHENSWETLGEIYFALGKYLDCIEAMTKCIELNGNSKKSAYEYRAKAYQSLGKKKEAKNDLEAVKRL